MEYVKNFSGLSKKDVGIAGGKGASLGEMTGAEIPVPPGYVVLSQAFERFLDETGIGIEIESSLHHLDHKDLNSVQNVSEVIRGLIEKVEFPADIAKEVMRHFKDLDAEFVAVRSSATAEDSSTASWAGELESYLNTVEKDLLETVKKCWSSLFTPRAIFYRFEKDLLSTKVSVAVVVQKMVQSDVSGICFTVHPVTEDRDQLVIEAGWGLGEAIVGGIITPDTYVIHKPDQAVMDKYISDQEIKITKRNGVTEEVGVAESDRERQKLSDEKIGLLAALCIKIEKHYGFPCDIEWAMEDDKLFITQSRPITTLS